MASREAIENALGAARLRSGMIGRIPDLNPLPNVFSEPDNEALTPERKRMKAWLKGMDPSKLAYFSMLLGIPISELTEEDVRSLEGT
jgi:hypothetical protein